MQPILLPGNRSHRTPSWGYGGYSGVGFLFPVPGCGPGRVHPGLRLAGGPLVTQLTVLLNRAGRWGQYELPSPSA
jgi:hypothetical protein